jgi:glycosyltransferase involved in cell wall biosynthesis
MKVAIVGNFWFPQGTASAARIRNLAFGLRDCGARVHVIAMAPHPRDGSRSQGLHEGVTFEHAAPTEAVTVGWRDAERTIPRLRAGLADKVAWFAGLYAAGPAARRRLDERIARGECDLLIAYDRSAVRIAPLARLCRRRGVTSVLDVVEASEHLGGSRLSPIYWDSVAGTRSTPRLFDGLTVISSGLEAEYASPGYPPAIIVPALSDGSLTAVPGATGRSSEFRLAWVSALEARDAPDLLLDAVRAVAARGIAVGLDVIGHYEGTARGRALAARCQSDPVLRPAVRLVGSASERQLQAMLASADGLILTRRDARTEVLSFPTRLVEYLGYGRPVFVSDVGDVRRYLRDGHSAVLLDPRDPARIAEAIAAVAASPDRGATIGIRGREAGVRAFDRKVHARRLLDFAGGLRLGRAA